jgi:uncharacterized membrane protein YfcA
MTEQLIVALIIFLAVFTQSLSGFGFALVAMTFLPAVIGIYQATPLVALVMATIEIFLLAHYRKELKFTEIWPIIASSIAGIPLGIYFLSRVDQKISMTVLGVIIVSYAVYALMEAYTHLIRLPELKHGAWAYLAGFIAGILGGAYNTSGPPVIIYGHSKGWPTAQFKSNLQGFFLISSLVIVLGHAWNYNLSADVWGYFLWSIPAMIIGIIAGTKLDKYIKPEIFRRVVLVLLLVMGMRLILA